MDSPYALQTVPRGCTCHPPVEYIAYGRACPEGVGRANRYPYQYHSYMPQLPSGYHMESPSYPVAHEPGRQPELLAVPVRREAMRYQPAAAGAGEPEVVLAPPPPVPVESRQIQPAPGGRELMDKAAAYPANTGPVCAVWPLPKPQRP